MKRATVALIAGIVLLVAADHYAADLANDQLLEADAHFLARLAEAQPDPHKLRRNSKPLCKIDRVFLIYPYQTCFEPWVASGSTSEWGYIFVYHRPVPRLTIFFTGGGEASYYFRELQLGETLYFIGMDGTIRKTLGGY